MARDVPPAPFPFPVPDPPSVQTRRSPFPPPPLPAPEDTASFIARRVAGIPLPLFFALGAVVGIVLTVAVLSIVRKSSSSRRPAPQASAAVARAAPVVEGAHGLFVWRPAVGTTAAPRADRPTEATPVAVAPPRRTAASAGRPRVGPRASVKGHKRAASPKGNLLTAGL
ncbi:MAG: hypothetical protein KF764_31745 [Labilithrix sp.]|nr:hypothetical protein [Labilithrix sp.]